MDDKAPFGSVASEQECTSCSTCTRLRGGWPSSKGGRPPVILKKGTRSTRQQCG
ncbi:hypothetical protein M407DRAFT_246405 [Tulasnella calospora MUT 4182]|uniref:Uncharacterized protein n=1 Tax=Tulasnella calospora MUT 4182 TaxID=1051891 RepID=A0A0C3Q656_9AGAM|nr:hypothetical protein M407DRAFT_246405 [Tulasnella calospora MUT 4182]